MTVQSSTLPIIVAPAQLVTVVLGDDPAWVTLGVGIEAGPPKGVAPSAARPGVGRRRALRAVGALVEAGGG